MAIGDTSRVISGYVDALVVRHPEHGAVAQFAQATNIPVVNGGDGPGEHPRQALLDLYTIGNEFARLGKRLDGAHVALIGDLKHGRTVHSLIKLLYAVQHAVADALDVGQIALADSPEHDSELRGSRGIQPPSAATADSIRGIANAAMPHSLPAPWALPRQRTMHT